MSIICWFFFKINEVLGNPHDIRWKSRILYINVFAIGFKFQINNNIFISTYFSEVKMMWNVAEKSIYYHNYYLFIYHFKFPTLSLWWLNTYHVECNSEFICHFVKKNDMGVFLTFLSLYCSELVSHTYPYILCLSSSIIIYNGIMFFGVWFTCIYKNGAPYRRFASPSLYDRINCQFHQSFMSSTSYRSRSLMLSWLNTVSWTWSPCCLHWIFY